MSVTFEENLRAGQIGESAIAAWLRRRGWNILPAYEKEIDTGKGPRLFMASTSDDPELITPDLLGIRNGVVLWFEAKHKTRFSWRGTGGYWETGVDRRHFDDYVKVQHRTSIPVWLFFLHRESIPWPKDRERWPDCPAACPTGLFGEKIDVLDAAKRFGPEWGRTGMYYWQPFAHLRFLASLEAVAPQEAALFF